MEITSLTVHETQALLRSRQVSPKEVIEALGRRIELVDPSIHGYLSYDIGRALSEAESADLHLPLGGVPISIKDVINVTRELGMDRLTKQAASHLATL